MITRLDHVAVIAGSLDATMTAYTSYGFEVRPGGSHQGLGTHNAIVRFGLDYLELLGVRDEAEALATGESGRIAVELARRPGIHLLGFAVATNDAEADAACLRALGVGVTLIPMERLRPDGRRLTWKLAVPEGVLWRRPLPFLIEWETLDADRLSWEAPGNHSNGAVGIGGVSVVVRDLQRAATLYGEALGLGSGIAESRQDLAAEGRRFSIAGQDIRVFAPTGDGIVAQALASAGEGLFEFDIHVRSTAAQSSAPRAYLGRVGTHDIL